MLQPAYSPALLPRTPALRKPGARRRADTAGRSAVRPLPRGFALGLGLTALLLAALLVMSGRSSVSGERAALPLPSEHDGL